MIEFNNNNMIMRFESLNKFSNLVHFVTTRHGGVSTGNYASFNCCTYTGDNIANVMQNQSILCKLTGAKNLVIPHQTHSTNIRTITKPTTTEDLEGIDALITAQKDICLCISTADCVPIFLYDPVTHVIALIHAGWRGTVAGITCKTIQQMKEQFNVIPNNLIATIGPSISLSDFEIGNEVYEAFKNKGFDMTAISELDTEANKYHIDLWKANSLLLRNCGLEDKKIEIANISTYSSHADFFSARQLGIKSGRILSGIMMR